MWQSTSMLNLGISVEQYQQAGKITGSQIIGNISSGRPVGVLYGNYDVNGEWSGHWVVVIGCAKAPGHNTLVISNDPNGGVQRVQTYNEFNGNYVGDRTPWRKWAATAR